MRENPRTWSGWRWRAALAGLALCATGAATAGARLTFAASNSTTLAGQAERRGGACCFQVDIDGARFRIVSRHATETSFDDGATTFFGADSDVVQTPLKDERGQFAPAPIAGWLEDERITLGPVRAGPVWMGYPTRVYDVDQRYTLVVRALLFLRRSRHSDHYTLTVIDAGLSPAPLRVSLTRGVGRNLGLHAEAFLGFPIRIAGQLRSAEPDKGVEMRTEMLLEARSIAPWSWEESASPMPVATPDTAR